MAPTEIITDLLPLWITIAMIMIVIRFSGITSYWSQNQLTAFRLAAVANAGLLATSAMFTIFIFSFGRFGNDVVNLFVQMN